MTAGQHESPEEVAPKLDGGLPRPNTKGQCGRKKKKQKGPFL